MWHTEFPVMFTFYRVTIGLETRMFVFSFRWREREVSRVASERGLLFCAAHGLSLTYDIYIRKWVWVCFCECAACYLLRTQITLHFKYMNDMQFSDRYFVILLWYLSIYINLNHNLSKLFPYNTAPT